MRAVPAPDETLLQTFLVEALHEDIGSGDHTALATVPEEARGKAKLLAKAHGTVAGVAVAERIFRHLDPTAQIEVLIRDGGEICPGDIVFYVSAHSRALLMGERLALNCMQRLSGVATLTRRYVDALRPFGTILLDTRKTTPRFRFLEKWAVRVAGGTNYRDGLYDRIMIKDNHTDFCGSIPKAIEQVHRYLREKQLALDITVEVRDLEELQQALDTGGIQRIMLDNFTPALLREAVVRIGGRFESEASGGITLENIAEYAATGVQFISVGALTHSYTSLDLSLKKV
jgi:nicotinate-nucleotide pyrophosphorylase (carboxylating)